MHYMCVCVCLCVCVCVHVCMRVHACVCVCVVVCVHACVRVCAVQVLWTAFLRRLLPEERSVQLQLWQSWGLWSAQLLLQNQGGPCLAGYNGAQWLHGVTQTHSTQCRTMWPKKSVCCCFSFAADLLGMCPFDQYKLTVQNVDLCNQRNHFVVGFLLQQICWGCAPLISTNSQYRMLNYVTKGIILLLVFFCSRFVGDVPLWLVQQATSCIEIMIIIMRFWCT